MAEQIENLVIALKYIHFDLEVIYTVLIFILVFKNCHGDSSGIIKAIREIKDTLLFKK